MSQQGPQPQQPPAPPQAQPQSPPVHDPLQIMLTELRETQVRVRASSNLLGDKLAQFLRAEYVGTTLSFMIDQCAALISLRDWLAIEVQQPLSAYPNILADFESRLQALELEEPGIDEELHTDLTELCATAKVVAELLTTASNLTTEQKQVLDAHIALADKCAARLAEMYESDEPDAESDEAQDG